VAPCGHSLQEAALSWQGCLHSWQLQAVSCRRPRWAGRAACTAGNFKLQVAGGRAELAGLLAQLQLALQMLRTGASTNGRWLVQAAYMRVPAVAAMLGVAVAQQGGLGLQSC
jgi:hypothetical protein